MSDSSSRIAQELAAWFEVEKRDLPWRRTTDPYAIWLSEVMLQQTRVATVLSYYPRFLRRFPTVEALAEADIDEVLGEFSGLGYYRRARALHLGAREVVERYGGKLPREAAELRTISGIGPYTAGAISSIAFGEREALVDGNVARVLARLFGVEEDIRSSRGNRLLWEIAREIVPRDEPGRHNEALMELGATICLPRGPRCLLCPVRSLCVANREGRQAELPKIARKKPPKRVEMAAIVVHRGEELLLGQRGEDGLFAKMWEPPMVELREKDEAKEAIAELLPIAKESMRKLGEAEHLLTHRALRITVFGAPWPARTELPEASEAYTQFVWLGPSEIEEGRGISSLSRKVLGFHPRRG